MRMKIILIISILALAFLLDGCGFYRNIYDSKSGLYLEEEMKKGQIPSEPYMTDANSCVGQCIEFNMTIIGFIISELAFETVTPIIYLRCMEKKGYRRAPENAL